MSIKKLIALALLLAIIFTGCTLQKRSYRKGYYVQRNSTKNKITTKESKTPEVIPLPEISSKQFNELVTASIDDKLILLPKKFPEDSIKEICNDSIWTREGAVSRVKILEVAKTEIKYKRCANINGPTIVVPSNSISKIKYANGMIESYQEVKKNGSVQKAPDASKSKTQAYDIGNIAGFCGIVFLACGVIALIALFAQIWILFAFFMILGAISYFITWVTSITALSKIRRSPDQYKGAGKALAALIVVAAYTILAIAFILLLLSAF